MGVLCSTACAQWPATVAHANDCQIPRTAHLVTFTAVAEMGENVERKGTRPLYVGRWQRRCSRRERCATQRFCMPCMWRGHALFPTCPAPAMNVISSIPCLTPFELHAINILQRSMYSRICLCAAILLPAYDVAAVECWRSSHAKDPRWSGCGVAPVTVEKSKLDLSVTNHHFGGCRASNCLASPVRTSSQGHRGGAPRLRVY